MGRRERAGSAVGTIGGKLPWNDWRNASSWRKATQFLLLAINIYIGVTFYYWVRYFETAGTSVYIPRPGGIEGWLPIAGLMNIRYTLETGFLPPIHAASMLLLVAFILISLLLKKPSVRGYARWARCPNCSAIWEKSLWSQLHAAALAGYPAAQSEVSVAEFLFVYRPVDACTGDSVFSNVGLWHDYRREDARFLSPYWLRYAHLCCRYQRPEPVYSQCLVPLSVPLWRAARPVLAILAV
jgi:hypothetical protein